MVIDSIDNADIYLSLSPNFKTAFDWMRQTDVTDWEAGRYEVDEDRVIARIQRYITAPAEELKAESHRQYADIQYVVSGGEKIGYDPIESATPTGETIPEADIIFYNPTSHYLNMNAGTFSIFWPQDVHMPRCMRDKPLEVLKVVMKVKV